jgi:hypothetical protein
VRLSGEPADPEALGDLLVGETLGDEPGSLWIETWPPPSISMFSFSCPTSTRLIGWFGAPGMVQTTDSRRSPDALIATSPSSARTRMDKTPASQSTISRRIDEPCRSTGGG